MRRELSIINIAESEFTCVIGDTEFHILFLTYPINSDKQTAEAKPFHTHGYYEAVYFSEGNVSFETEDGKHVLKPGDVVVESPSCEHKYCGIESSMGYKIGFCYNRTKKNGNFFGAFDGVFGNLRYKIFENRKRFKCLFDILADSRGKESELTRMRAAFIGLVFEIYDALVYENGTPTNLCSEQTSERDVKDVIANALLFHYTSDISVEDIASRVFLSSRQINRICKKIYGRTFNEQKTYCRIERAARLLEETRKSVIDICYDCGFTSLGSFYSAFDNYKKTSPAKYRKTTKNS